MYVVTVRIKLTAQNIKKLKLENKPYEARDTDVKGFLVRIQPTGTMSYYYSYRDNCGKKKRVCLGKHGTISPTQARKAAEQMAGRVALLENPAEDKKRRRIEYKLNQEKIAKQRTLKQFIKNEYMEWCEIHKKRGLANVTNLLTAFKEFGEYPLNELTLWQFEKWRSQRLKKGFAPSTITRNLAEIRAMFNRAVDWGFLEQSPLIKFKMQKFDNARTRYLSVSEEAKLRLSLSERDQRIKQLRKNGNQWREERGYDLYPDTSSLRFGDYLTPIVLLALNTGMRKGELFGLQWEHINFTLNQLTVVTENSKSGKARYIPINEQAIQLLQDWSIQTKSNKGIVFSSNNGHKLSDIKKSWMNLLKEAEIKGFVFHDLRHTFASKLVMAGVDLNTVRELLGHADIKMTLRYTHLAPEHKASAVALLL